jgi:hypothetical protein
VAGADIIVTHPSKVSIKGGLDALAQAHRDMIATTIANAKKSGMNIKKGLVTIHDATHGGMINHNIRRYSHQDLQTRAYKTFYNPFPKPIVPIDNMNGVDHSNQIDAIGRIYHAHPYEVENGSVKTGTLVVKTGGIITDSSAIERIQDGRYLNVSAGFLGRAVCSVCNKQVAKINDGCVKHKIGRFYTDSKEVDSDTPNAKFSFLDVDNINYYHLAYVNTPAHYNAGNVAASTFEDSDKLSGTLFDTLKYELTINEFLDKAGLDAIDYMGTSIIGGDSIVVDLNESVSVTVNGNKDDLTIIGIMYKDANDQELTDSEWKILDRLLDQEMGDAKLSTETRNKMESKSFCGPERSFPIPDCAHVTAAKRLIGRYQGPGSKSRILSCVNRKANEMSCGGDNSSDPDNNDNNGDSVLMDAKEIAKELKDSLLNDPRFSQPQDNDLNDRITVLEESNRFLESDLEKVKQAKEIKDSLFANMSLEVASNRKVMADANRQSYIMYVLMTDESARTEDSLKQLMNLSDSEINERVARSFGSDSNKFYSELMETIKGKPPVNLKDKVTPDSKETDNNITDKTNPSKKMSPGFALYANK